MAAEIERADDGKFHHGCGESFTHAGWYTKHALKCNGKPVPTRGRIERLAARTGRELVRNRSIAKRAAIAPAPAVTPAQPAVAAIAAAATDKAMELTLIGLRARRLQIDIAISALEAVSLEAIS